MIEGSGAERRNSGKMVGVIPFLERKRADGSVPWHHRRLRRLRACLPNADVIDVYLDFRHDLESRFTSPSQSHYLPSSACRIPPESHLSFLSDILQA